MLSWIRKRFAPVFYVQIWERKLKVTEISTKKVYEDLPLMAIQTLKSGEKKIVTIGKDANSSTSADTIKVNPFSHPRVLFSDFYVGEKILLHAFSTFAEHKFLRVTPKTIIHPMEKTEGGLTMIEVRAFRELALGAGSIESKVYLGKPLSVAQFNFDLIQDIDGINDIGVSPKTKDDVGFVTVLLVVLIFTGVFYFGT
jgi:rod shape-determining protein MreB